MSWERRGSGLYYYRAKKVAGRVRKEYVGCGIVALATALDDENDRSDRAGRRAEERALRAELADLDASLVALTHLADSILTDSLGRAGYYRHHRGEWRRRGKVTEA